MSEIGIFRKKITVVWIGVKCLKIMDLHSRILKEFGIKDHNFKPHISLLRIKSPNDNFVDELKQIKIPKMTFKVESFKLFKSTLTKGGAIHETLATYFLS